MELKVDPQRVGNETGILVRSLGVDGKWGAFDIAELTAESLLEWLKSRGGDNQMAEDTVGIILGHGHLHKSSPG